MRAMAPKIVLPAWATLALIAPVLAQQGASTYRLAYTCPERGPPTSVCVAGKLAPGAKITLVTTDKALPASAKNRFTDEESGDTFTRVEASQTLAEKTPVVAALLPLDTIKVVPQVEIHDAGIVERLKRHVAKDLEDYAHWCVEEGEKCRLTTQLVRLSPAMVIAVVKYSSDQHIFFQKAFAVGQQIVDLNKGSPVENTMDWCARLDLAFTVSGHLHVATTHYTCEGDGSYDSINDLSGPTPRLVAQWNTGL